MATNKPKQILIAALDWGLGHTTRCMPIISHILKLGHTPVVAGTDSQCSFIAQTFPEIKTVQLPGYNITYSAANRWLQAGLLLQLPHILKTIKEEHQALLQICRDQQIDGIISDNRYGLHHPSIPSVIMTHQLQVRTGISRGADSLLMRLHYKYLERFGATWIVDTPGAANLGGALSHPGTAPNDAKYIGLLSRFAGWNDEKRDCGYLLILLSGPEPQRSILSAKVWTQLKNFRDKVVFVEGSDTAVTPDHIPANITHHKRLPGELLAPLIASAHMVVCRSGYSTLMDLTAIGGKAIVIPTPGQTEQEYLGKHLHDSGIFFCARQEGFDLGQSLQRAATFPFHKSASPTDFELYRGVLEDWIERQPH